VGWQLVLALRSPLEKRFGSGCGQSSVLRRCRLVLQGGVVVEVDLNLVNICADVRTCVIVD
jgi:hypothetical protein